MENHDELSRENIVQYLNSRKKYFRRKFHIRKIALIGSFARNEQNPQSDIDIIIDLEEKAPAIFESKLSLKKELEHKFGRTVVIASEKYLKPYYRDAILREAVYV